MFINIRKALAVFFKSTDLISAPVNDIYVPYLFTREEWDRQYLNGRWDYLRTIGEAAHYGVILSYLYTLGHPRRILDVGCGEGLLHAMLDSQRYDHYLGIDISSEVINRVSANKNNKSVFECTDARTYNANNGKQFDAIIFNESLYYFEDPLGVLQRYEHCLARSGVFIISMYKEAQTQKIWQMIETTYHIEDAVQVANSSGISWTVKVIVPKSC